MKEFFSENDKIAHSIGEWGEELIEKRQVYSQLHKLLPIRYAECVQKYKEQNYSAGKAQRLALLDSDYIERIEELNELRSSILRLKVDFDTHHLLFQAKKNRAVSQTF